MHVDGTVLQCVLAVLRSREMNSGSRSARAIEDPDSLIIGCLLTRSSVKEIGEQANSFRRVTNFTNFYG